MMRNSHEAKCESPPVALVLAKPRLIKILSMINFIDDKDGFDCKYCGKQVELSLKTYNPIVASAKKIKAILLSLDGIQEVIATNDSPLTIINKFEVTCQSKNKAKKLFNLITACFTESQDSVSSRVPEEEPGDWDVSSDYHLIYHSMTFRKIIDEIGESSSSAYKNKDEVISSKLSELENCFSGYSHEHSKEIAETLLVEINNMTSAELRRGRYTFAKQVYRKIMPYAEKILDQENLTMLRLRHHYGTALVASHEHEEGVQMLKTVINNSGLEISPEQADVLSGSYYLLAQVEMARENYDIAHTNAIQSIQIRINLCKPNSEIIKVDNLIKKIKALKEKSEPRDLVKRFLQEYKQKKTVNELDFSLIHLLDNIIRCYKRRMEIEKSEKYNSEIFHYLSELLKLQTHYKLQYDSVVTKLSMLRILNGYMASDEYTVELDSIEYQINAMTLEEGLNLAQVYYHLADVRLANYALMYWPYEVKIDYLIQTELIITKGLRHIEVSKGSGEIFAHESLDTALRELMQVCLRSIKLCKDAIDEQMTCTESLSDSESSDAKDSKEASSGSSLTTMRHLAKLSCFSSDVQHSLVSESVRILSIDEFHKLPGEGTINPCRLRAAQGGFNKKFRDGRLLSDMKRDLVANPDYTNEIRPIEIGVYKGKVFSFDTRRLMVHMQASEENPDVYINYKKIEGDYLEERVEAIFSDRPYNGLVTAQRLGGKRSESRPYINPAYRDQLSNEVSKSFAQYPSQRDETYDANGFAMLRGRAKKISKFLTHRVEERDSERSKQILKQTKNIAKKEGINNGKEAGNKAAWRYLVKQKNAAKRGGEENRRYTI